MECYPHTRLAGECLQPLGHLSGVRICASLDPDRGTVGTERRLASGRQLRRGGRAVECASLENWSPATPDRGFESRPLRCSPAELTVTRAPWPRIGWPAMTDTTIP